MPTLFDQTAYQPKNKSIVRLVENYSLKYNDLFVKVKADWLPAIREFLREETGLRTHQKLKGVKILKDSNLSFDFIPDRHESFIKLIDQYYPNLDFDEYIAFNKLNFQLKRSANFFDATQEKPIKAYNELAIYITGYFKQYDLGSLIINLFKNSGKSADIWGTYFYYGARIEIYYIPLILFCRINNISLEHAITTTLVHEMAHAYHHVGKDKDNITWQKMSDADIRIKEGMAEYFTWLFVETYNQQYPDMKKTYDCMFKCLGEEYTIFREWGHEKNRETIKSALLATRKKSIIKYAEFENLLKDLKKLMH